MAVMTSITKRRKFQTTFFGEESNKAAWFKNIYLVEYLMGFMSFTRKKGGKRTKAWHAKSGQTYPKLSLCILWQRKIRGNLGSYTTTVMVTHKPSKVSCGHSHAQSMKCFSWHWQPFENSKSHFTNLERDAQWGAFALMEQGLLGGAGVHSDITLSKQKGSATPWGWGWAHR